MTVECHMDPTINKVVNVNWQGQGCVTCAESESTPRVPCRVRFYPKIRVKMLGDKKTPISTVVGERKQQLQMVGGYDNIRERVHTVFMNRWNDFHVPIHTTVFCQGQTVEGIKMDIWSVMEDFSRIPPT